MPDVYQHAKADGSPDWSKGTQDFETFWNKVYDEERFHRGDGFTIKNRQSGEKGPAKPLKLIDDAIVHQLADHPEMVVFEITSVADGFTMLVRRQRVPETDKGIRVLDHLRTKIGLPYKLGYLVPSGFTDCSGATMWANGLEGVEGLPHKAEWQMDKFGRDHGFVRIGKSDLQGGDLIEHWNGDHVSSFLDWEGGGRVIDTEPHDTNGAPSGWPRPTMGIGMQIRTMAAGYYCDWAHVGRIGRIVAINGAP